jgi:hypothetical protein
MVVGSGALLGDREAPPKTENSAAALALSFALRSPIPILPFPVGFILVRFELWRLRLLLGLKTSGVAFHSVWKLATPLSLRISFCLTLKISHACGWRGACAARSVTDIGVAL